MSSNGVSLVPNSSPAGYDTALPSTLVSPKGYIYRWNNWYGGKVQILKYENGTFSVVRESATLEGFEKTEVATMFLTARATWLWWTPPAPAWCSWTTP